MTKPHHEYVRSFTINFRDGTCSRRQHHYSSVFKPGPSLLGVLLPNWKRPQNSLTVQVTPPVIKNTANLFPGRPQLVPLAGEFFIRRHPSAQRATRDQSRSGVPIEEKDQGLWSASPKGARWQLSCMHRSALSLPALGWPPAVWVKVVSGLPRAVHELAAGGASATAASRSWNC